MKLPSDHHIHHQQQQQQMYDPGQAWKLWKDGAGGSADGKIYTFLNPGLGSLTNKSTFF
jgi:hypothetical protein